MRHLALFIGSLAAFTPGLAYAAGAAGNSSSGTVTVTVDIPPISAALRAQAEGAVGLWTVTDSVSSFMIKLPDQMTTDGTVDAAIFHGSDVQFSLSVEADRVALSTPATDAFNGLTRESFGLSWKQQPATTPVNFAPTVRPATTLLVSGL